MTTPPKLLVTYQTPRFAYGDVVACARRSEVRIVGLSEAPIPWLIGKTQPKGRKRSLVLYGGMRGGRRLAGIKSSAAWWAVPGLASGACWTMTGPSMTRSPTFSLV